MRNRFNINESEKNRIRKLHKNYSVIKEQIDIVDESRAKIIGCTRGVVSSKAEYDLIANL